MQSPFTYRGDSSAMVVGVGLMGQHFAATLLRSVALKRLVLVDAKPNIAVGTESVPLVDFANQLSKEHGIEVASEVIDVTSSEQVGALFQRNRDIGFLQHTAGISPKPLTPPEDLVRADVIGACDVNLWGTHNLIAQGVKSGAFVHGARGVIILSTSATVGSEGRASAAYEESKGGLLNFLRLQARYFAEKYGLILNGLAPSPLRGPMAAQNPVSAGRLAAVEAAMPMGSLTNPEHISAATLFFMAQQCWCLGEVLTVDGGYTKHQPFYGALPTGTSEK